MAQQSRQTSTGKGRSYAQDPLKLLVGFDAQSADHRSEGVIQAAGHSRLQPELSSLLWLSDS
jgi:hypothetical protein